MACTRDEALAMRGAGAIGELPPESPVAAVECPRRLADLKRPCRMHDTSPGGDPTVGILAA